MTTPMYLQKRQFLHPLQAMFSNTAFNLYSTKYKYRWWEGRTEGVYWSKAVIVPGWKHTIIPIWQTCRPVKPSWCVKQSSWLWEWGVSLISWTLSIRKPIKPALLISCLYWSLTPTNWAWGEWPFYGDIITDDEREDSSNYLEVLTLESYFILGSIFSNTAFDLYLYLKATSKLHWEMPLVCQRHQTSTRTSHSHVTTLIPFAKSGYRYFHPERTGVFGHSRLFLEISRSAKAEINYNARCHKYFESSVCQTWYTGNTEVRQWTTVQLTRVQGLCLQVPLPTHYQQPPLSIQQWTSRESSTDGEESPQKHYQSLSCTTLI